MILERKTEDVVWMLWVLNMALRINKPHLHTHIGTTKAHVSVSFLSMSLLSGYFERPTRKLVAYVLGAKLLQFFETPKCFAIYL